jgi:hypothetical protein
VSQKRTTEDKQLAEMILQSRTKWRPISAADVEIPTVLPQAQSRQQFTYGLFACLGI